MHAYQDWPDSGWIILLETEEQAVRSIHSMSKDVRLRVVEGQVQNLARADNCFPEYKNGNIPYNIR